MMDIGAVLVTVIVLIGVAVWVKSLTPPDDNEILDGLGDEDLDELFKPRR